MLNNLVIVGRACADPQTKYTPNGKTVATFTLAVDRKFKGANGEKQTDFFRCQAWNKTAEFAANYVHKGDLLAVQGSISIDTVEQKTYVTVNAESVQLLHSKQGNGAQGGQVEPGWNDGMDEEVPF